MLNRTYLDTEAVQIGIQKGMRQGMQQGIEKGINESLTCIRVLTHGNSI